MEYDDVVEFEMKIKKEWESFVRRFDCPACRHPMVIVTIVLTIQNVMEYQGPAGPASMGTLVQRGFNFNLSVLDRCPACMGEYHRTYHVKEEERARLLDLIATAVTRDG